MQTQRPIQRALISVSDKTNIVEFAHQLAKKKIEILATGGTAKLLKENAIPIVDIADYTGFPEIMGGRVKTLHPKIYGGLLGRRETDDAVMIEHDIPPIDLLVVNLYPFSETIKNPDCQLTDAVEQIDIGGPSMLRAGAKNFSDVTVIVDSADYDNVLDEIKKTGNTLLKCRERLAIKVFAHTAMYDQQIAHYLTQALRPSSGTLRYGENPHQSATFIQHVNTEATECIQGKALSYNNLIDADCAVECVKELDPKQAACVIVKHATPCGAAESGHLVDAYEKAYRCDPESAFGGIIAFNQTLDQKTTETILSQQFVEVILAPQVTADAKIILEKKPNLRVIRYPQNHSSLQTSIHSISNGLLIQQKDTKRIELDDLKIVTKRKPTDAELKDLLFAWRIVKFTKSNAIVYAKDQATLGIGTGQTSRVFAGKIATLRAEAAGLSLKSASMASDAFFPFADGIEIAAKAGIQSIIQPGGSKRDDEVIAAANAHNITMVFTNTRHFRH